MNVEGILKIKGSAVATIEAHITVKGASAMLAERGIGAIIVTKDGELAGILSERDIARSLAKHGADTPDLPVSALMTEDVVTCTPQDDIGRLMRIMSEHRIRHLPVLRDDRLCGLVSIGDVVKARIEEIEFEAESLRTYVAG